MKRVKIEISYEVRYKLLSSILTKDSISIYKFLDKETEFLTNYIARVHNIYLDIRTREKQKIRLLVKESKSKIISNIKYN